MKTSFFLFGSTDIATGLFMMVCRMCLRAHHISHHPSVPSSPGKNRYQFQQARILMILVPASSVVTRQALRCISPRRSVGMQIAIWRTTLPLLLSFPVQRRLSAQSRRGRSLRVLSGILITLLWHLLEENLWLPMMKAQVFLAHQ